MITAAALLAVAGRISDREIARRLGCSRSLVGRFRALRGIPTIPAEIDHTPAWWPSVADRAGQVSDIALAAEVGLSKHAVRKQRAKHGIEAWRMRRVG